MTAQRYRLSRLLTNHIASLHAHLLITSPPIQSSPLLLLLYLYITLRRHCALSSNER